MRALAFLIPIVGGMGVQSALNADVVELQVTGRVRRVNGFDMVPRALFGVHATRLTREQREAWGVEAVRVIQRQPGKPAAAREDGIDFIIECFFDRYDPAWIVRYADWDRRLVELARQYAEGARNLVRPAVVEFWNEPYLNWGVRPGVNYDGAFYREEGREPGAPMTLRYASAPSPYLVWTKQLVAVPWDKTWVDYVASRYLPPGVKPGDEFTWRGTRYRVEERWWGRDRTQHSFWPGRQNVEWYNRMLPVFARALKEANPAVSLIAGWDFHVHQNDYAAWEDVHRPTIDAGIEWLDGYTEHHYGGDTRAVAASYETVAAYAWTRHGRWLRVWNTEAGGELDPEQPGTGPGGYNVLQGPARERGGLVYTVRDILHLLDVCPDKAAARAAHEMHVNRGVIAAFRLLKPLRGRLMEARSSDRDVWAVASLADGRLSIAVYNDAVDPKPYELSVTAPRGTRVAEIQEYRLTESLDLAVETRTGEPGPAASGILQGREARVWVLTLQGSAEPETVEERQFFAGAVVERIPPGGRREWEVRVDEGVWRAAEAVWLRICVRGWRAVHHRLSVNGIELSPDRRVGIQDLPLSPDHLAPVNRIRVETSSDAPELLLENISVRVVYPAVTPR